MANYIGATRTNYFRVVDEKKLRNIVDKIIIEDSIESWEENENSIELWEENIDNEKYFAFGATRNILGISNNEVEEDSYDCEYDKMCKELKEIVHLEDSIIITRSGYEKLSCVDGYSTIITKNGIEHINLWKQAIECSKKLLNNNKYETKYTC